MLVSTKYSVLFHLRYSVLFHLRYSVLFHLRYRNVMWCFTEYKHKCENGVPIWLIIKNFYHMGMSTEH